MKAIEHELLREAAGRGPLRPFQDRFQWAEVFHLQTSLNRLNAPAYVQGLQAVTADPVLRELMARPGKTFSLVEDRRELPVPQPAGALETALSGRRSVRAFRGGPVALDHLARLLFFSYGVLPGRRRRRPVASAGALYPLEVYVLAFDVLGLPCGVYHYDSGGHRLDRLSSGDPKSAARELLFAEGIDLDGAGLAIVVTAVLVRSLLKYQDRGYRMVLLEAGELAQSIDLMTTSLGLGMVWLGGFYDEELAGLLKADPVGEPVLLAGVVGQRPEASDDPGKLPEGMS